MSSFEDVVFSFWSESRFHVDMRLESPNFTWFEFTTFVSKSKILIELFQEGFILEMVEIWRDILENLRYIDDYFGVFLVFLRFWFNPNRSHHKRKNNGIISFVYSNIMSYIKIYFDISWNH